MSNFQKLVVVGKLVSDVTYRSFSNGGGVAKFGVPMNFGARKKDPDTGEWSGIGMIMNVDVFDNAPRNLATLVRERCHKGSLILVEGRLKPNEYTNRDGDVVKSVVMVADNIQFLDSRATLDEGQTPFEHSDQSPAPNPAPNHRAPATQPRTVSATAHVEQGPEEDGGGVAVAEPPKAPTTRRRPAAKPKAPEPDPDEINF